MNPSIHLHPIVVPLVCALICYLFGRSSERGGRTGKGFLRALALIAAIWTLVTTIQVFRAKELTPYIAQWSSFGALDLTIVLAAGPLGAFVAAGIAFFTLLIVLYSFGYREPDQRDGDYLAFILCACAGGIAAVYSKNLIYFLVAWEVVTVMLFLLVNLGGEKARQPAAKSFIVLGFSDCAILLGVVLLFVRTGKLMLPGAPADQFALLEAIAPTGGAMVVIYLLLLVGALAKAGAFPVHTWVPSIAEGSPAPVMAFLPASLDKLLGIYFLWLISMSIFDIGEATGLRSVLLVVGAITILAAVMMAMVQHNLKKLLSFHAVSQVGYMVAGIGAGPIGVVGGLFHMVNHAMYKCTLFLVAGHVEKRTGTMELSRMGGLAQAMPVTFFGGCVAALAISGVPPLNGFASKWMVYQGIMQASIPVAPFVLVAAVVGSALTLASFVKVIHSVFWGQRPVEMRVRDEGAGAWCMKLPILVLAVLCILFGLMAAHVAAFIARMADQTVSLPNTGVGLWDAGPAALLLILGLAIGILLYLYGRATSANIREVKPFIGGEVGQEARTHLPGTAFYKTAAELPGLKTMYRDGEAGAYDGYRLLGRYGLTLVEQLRRFHTGALPVYVSWCAAGLVIIALILMLC